jgi:crotonobetainyl-CoA:carnitine CoA-transferase CaiB-like acyl-CoA transferase
MTTEAVREAGGSLPLEGIRVLELGGGVPAGFCTHLLAGFGADVVQVGDPGLTADEELYLSRGKRRVDATADDLAWLLERATVVVDGRSPSAGDRGLPSAAELREQHPHLLVTVLTPFGLHGPHSAHRATNIVSFANGGIMAITGEPDRPPLQTGGDQALMLGGLHGFAATTVALVGALLQGEGDLIDISLQECAASMLEGHGSAWEYESVFDERAGNMFRAEWAVYPVMDGWAALCCLGRQVPTLLNVIGVEPETKFLDPVQRGDYNDELFVHVLQFMVAHTKDELTALSPVHKLPVGAVRTPADLVAHQPLVERGFFDPADSDGGGGAGGSLPGRPFPGLGWASLGPVASVPVDVVRGEWDSARVPA